MNKIERSRRLLKAAFAVMLAEKKLLLFPLIATGLALVAALFFLAPIAFYPTGQPVLSAAHWQSLGNVFLHEVNPAHSGSGRLPISFGQGRLAASFSEHPWLGALLALAYFTSMFLATFSNVAFYHEIMQALNGGRVSLRRGYRFAASRWQAILLWSVFAGLVGYLIQQIEQRVGFLGRIIMGFVGMAWSAACVFVIPVLVRDTGTTNPVRLLRNSAGTLRRTWGELVIGFVGLQLAFGVFFMMAIVLAMLTVIAGAVILGASLGSHAGIFPEVICVVGVFALMVPLSWLSSVINSVYRCALYIYATEGVVPGAFDKELLDSAWKVKSR